MANMLAWLTGRDDNTGQPPPVRWNDGQPSLTASPSAPPSEQFSHWLAGLLGAGPGASLPRQKFAEGVPSLLMATPLGIGLSAADLVHAKRADDPLGAAAAAIGMIPGAGPAGRKAAAYGPKSAQEAEHWIAEALNPYLPPLKAPAAEWKKAPAAPKDPTQAALDAISEVLGPAKTPMNVGNLAAPVKDVGPFGKPKWDYEQNGKGKYEIFNAFTGKTHAAVDNEDTAKAVIKMYEDTGNHPPAWGTTTQRLDKKVLVEKNNPFDYKQNKFGNYDIFHSGTGEIHDVVPSAELAEKTVSDFGHYHSKDPEVKGPLWSGAGYKVEQPAAAKPVFDYEKDDNGLYHVFDAVTGKTHTVVNTPNEAKAWIGKQTGKPLDVDPEAVVPKPWSTETVPQIPAKPPWLGTVLPEDQREAARLAGGYTTPAWRGINVSPGKDVGTVFHGDEMFSSNSPLLADMYASSFHQHPDNYAAQGAYRQGASTLPLWIDTSKYHVEDAGGKMWSDFNFGAIRRAQEKGAPGVTIHNVWDEPHSTTSLGKPQTIHITFPEGQSTVKSKFAGEFNPMSKDIARILAVMFGGGTMALPLMNQKEQKQ